MYIHTHPHKRLAKFANSPPKPEVGSMTLEYQRFRAMLLIYGSLFLRVFWCALAIRLELESEQ
jgi:hypothetical protein